MTWFSSLQAKGRATVAFGALVCLITAADGYAQTTLYLRTLDADLACPQPSCQAQLLTAQLDPPAVRSVEDIDDRAPATYVFPDGSLTAGLRDAATEQAAIVLRNPATRATVAVPTPRASTLIGNPTRAEVYFNDAQGAVAASFAGVRRLLLPACATTSGGFAISISADGRRVAYSYQCGSSFTGIVVIDTVLGTTVGTLPDVTDGGLSPDGATFYALVGTTIRRFDVSTAAVLSTVDFAPATPAVPVISPATGAVLVTFAGSAGGGVYDANLQLIRTGLLPFGQWWFDPHRSRAYVLARYRDGMPPVTFESVRVIDTTTWTEQLNVPLGAGGPRASLVVAHVPAPPVQTAPVVQGAGVQLAWTPAGPAAAVTRYILEVGSATGVSDIISGVDLGLQTSFAASGVPPGRYYVRVRAGNYTGLSVPSNEVVVIVP